MSNIDKLMEKMKSAAMKLNCEQWQTRNGFSGVEVIVKGSVAKGDGCVSYQPVASELVDTKTAKAIALFCPANILALLDELEAAEKRIAELEARTATLPENITSANAPEVFEISSEAERLGLRGTYASYAVGWNARGMADKEALRAASICIDGES